MSLQRQRTDIETYFMAQMLILHPGLVMIGENADTPPANNAPWLRMSLTLLDITYPCIGQNDVQTDAIFNIQVHTPIGQGAFEASQLVDDARQVLRGSALTGIEFLSFDAPAGMLEADWFVSLLRAEYRAQD